MPEITIPSAVITGLQVIIAFTGAFFDIVGPVCESSDYLGRNRFIPAVKQGDLLAVFSAGAYGAVMGSQYNTRCRAAEVLVESDGPRLIRRRETFDDIMACERNL